MREQSPLSVLSISEHQDAQAALKRYPNASAEEKIKIANTVYELTQTLKDKASILRKSEDMAEKRKAALYYYLAYINYGFLPDSDIFSEVTQATVTFESSTQHAITDPSKTLQDALYALSKIGDHPQCSHANALLDQLLIFYHVDDPQNTSNRPDAEKEMLSHVLFLKGGIEYLKNKGYNTALYYLKKAEKNGHSLATVYLMSVFNKLYKQEKRPQYKEQYNQQYMEYLKKAAAQGNPTAIYSLGETTIKENRTDISKALELFKEAATFYLPHAMYQLSCAVQENAKTPINDLEPVQYYYRAYQTAEDDFTLKLKIINNLKSYKSHPLSQYFIALIEKNNRLLINFLNQEKNKELIKTIIKKSDSAESREILGYFIESLYKGFYNLHLQCSAEAAYRNHKKKALITLTEIASTLYSHLNNDEKNLSDKAYLRILNIAGVMLAYFFPELIFNTVYVPENKDKKDILTLAFSAFSLLKSESAAPNSTAEVIGQNPETYAIQHLEKQGLFHKKTDHSSKRKNSEISNTAKRFCRQKNT